jgi:uncharacterized peroxidase-related enzyme
MNRVPLIDPAAAAPEVKRTLEQIGRALGATPAMFRAVANSPAALKSMWGSFGALGGGTLGPRLGELIAVAVAERNRCEYCLAAHHALGLKAGVGAGELAAAQGGEAADARTQAALRFALKLVDARGQVSAADVQALRGAGFDDGQLVEVIAHVALNLFTNFVNIALEVPVDFPAVALRRAA